MSIQDLDTLFKGKKKPVCPDFGNVALLYEESHNVTASVIVQIAAEVSFGSRDNVLNARTRSIIIHNCVFQGSSGCIFKYLGKKDRVSRK